MPDPASTTTDVPIISTDEIVTLARAGHRAALRSVLARVVLAGEQGRAALDGAFTVLAVDKSYTGPVTDEPLVVLLQCCPHPWRITSGACTVCHTVVPARIAPLRPTETTTMPDPGEPFDLPATDLPVLGDGFATAYELPDLTGRDRRARRVLTRGMADVRAELLRVDAKANSLLALAGVLLGLAVLGLGKVRDEPLAVGAAVIATGVVLYAVVMLARAMRPNLRGNFGFVFWSRTRSAEELLAHAGELPINALLDQANELRWLSSVLVGKYVWIRCAVMLLLIALGFGVLAAALTLWPR